MRGCLISYSQAEPGRELTQPRKHIFAEQTNRSIAICIIAVGRKACIVNRLRYPNMTEWQNLGCVNAPDGQGKQ